MELSRYHRVFMSRDDQAPALVYSTLRGALLQVDDDLAAALQSGLVPKEAAETLARLGIVVPDATAEQQQVMGFFDWANANASRFTALVTLNLDCNLDCPYCYESHFRGKSYMSDETADRLVAMLLDGPLAAGRNLLLDFYGGEALLSTRQIRRIAEPLQAAARARGVTFSFNLVTNGTLLTRTVVNELLPLGLTGARITLDGPPEIHNVQRPFVSGKGSFTTILANMKDVSSLIKVQLGGNFTRDNYRRFPELLDILAAEGVTPEQLYMVQFSPVVPTAGEAGMSDFTMGCACSSEPWLIEATLWLRNEIVRRGWQTPTPKLAGCMIEFDNDLVVSWDGSLYKCPAFMGWDDLCIGTLTDGISDYHRSHNMDVWKSDECRECPYLPLCFGGCRFLRRLQTGAIDGVDCRREYFDQALETIIRQDFSQKLGKIREK